MENMLEESEEREQMLIDHSKQLQRDLEQANAENVWWSNVIDKELGLVNAVNQEIIPDD